MTSFGLDADDIECGAEDVYRAANADMYDPPGNLRLAKKLPQIQTVRWVAHLDTPAMTIANDNGRYTICLARRLRRKPLEALWCAGHEIAEAWYSSPCRIYLGEDREQVMEATAAALTAPRPALRQAVRTFGFDIPRLAQIFRISEIGMALRLGEAGHLSVAVIGRIFTKRRGNWTLPEDSELRKIAARARATGETGVDCLHVAFLTDPQHIVIYARE